METFSGQSHPTKKVLELIGEEGVAYIHNTLKLFRETKRKIYGIADIKVYFHRIQYFKVLGQKYTIEVNSIENNPNGDYALEISDWDATNYKRRKEVTKSLQIPLRP